MSQSQSNNSSHNQTVSLAESSRQVAVAGATQATVRTAEITFYRAVKASAIANSCGVGAATRALQELGTGGQ